MNTPLFAASRGFTVKDWIDPGGALIHVQAAETRTGTATAAGTGTESLALDVDIWRKVKGALQPLQIMVVGTGPGYGSLVLAENYRMALDYAGNDNRVEPCVCVTGDSTTVDENAYHLGGSGDGETFLSIVVQPSGAFELDVPIGSMSGTSKGVFATSGCGSPPVHDPREDYLYASLPKVTVAGQLDPSKASGEITGSVTLATSLSVPGTVGGLYSGGLSQLPVSPVVKVDYAFSYTLTRITIPGRMAPTEPPLASTAPRLVVPANTSWQAAPRLTARQLSCAPPGGP
jgi:hypothetical protein